MRGSASGRLVLDDVVVPAEARRCAGAVATSRIRAARRRAPGSRWPSRRPTSGWGRAPAPTSPAGRSTGGPGDGSTAVADIPSVQLRLGRLDADAAGRADRRARRRAALGRDADAASGPTSLPTCALAKLVAHAAPPSTATDEALRIAGGPGFLAGRLERAFRDARAGLINPPLEDVALTGFARAVLEREGRHR